MKKFPTIPFISILLIFIGGDLLMDRLDIYYVTWPELIGAILSAQGLLLVAYSFRDQQTSRAIWGILFMASGFLLFFPQIVNQVDWILIRDNIRVWWPLVFVLLGVWILLRSVFRKTEL